MVVTLVFLLRCKIQVRIPLNVCCRFQLQCNMFAQKQCLAIFHKPYMREMNRHNLIFYVWGLNRHLQCPHTIQVLVQVLAGPLLIQLPANVLETALKDASGIWTPRAGSRFIKSIWLSLAQYWLL